MVWLSELQVCSCKDSSPQSCLTTMKEKHWAGEKEIRLWLLKKNHSIEWRYSCTDAGAACCVWCPTTADVSLIISEQNCFIKSADTPSVLSSDHSTDHSRDQTPDPVLQIGHMNCRGLYLKLSTGYWIVQIASVQTKDVLIGRNTGGPFEEEGNFDGFDL